MTMPSSVEFVLDYSRFHGIAKDHLAIDPTSLEPRTVKGGTVYSFETVKGCPSLDLDALREPLFNKYREKLSISKAGAVFLTSVIRTSTIDTMKCAPKWDEILPDRHRVIKIKQEPPVLRTDHEYDMQLFRATITDNRVDVNLSMERLCHESDEGLAFPNYVHHLPAHFYEQIVREKLDCTREVLAFLQKIRKVTVALPACTDEKECPTYTRKPGPDPITPPLVPRDLTSIPFIPSSPCMRMDVLSEPDTPELPGREILEAALVADANLFSEEASDSDSGGISSNRILDTFIALKGTDRPPSSNLSPRKRTFSQSIKVDSPLTPPISAKKRCAEEKAKTLDVIIKANPLPSMAISDEEMPSSLGGLLCTSALAKKQIESKIMSERIRGANAEVRVQIPKLAGLCPDPPWLVPPKKLPPASKPVDLSRNLIALVSKNHNLTSSQYMTGDEERDLRWNPFPQGLSKMDVQESIRNDGIMHDILFQPGAINENTKLLERPCSKKSDLDQSTGDGVLEVDGNTSEKPSAPVAKTPQERHERTYAPGRNESQSFLPLTQKIRSSNSQISPNSVEARSSLLSSQFSALKHLSNFMSIRGNQSQKLGVPRRQCTEERPEAPGLIHENEHQIVATEEDEVPEAAASVVDFDSPATGDSEPPFPLTLILSNSLLRSHRSVVQTLEGLSTPKTLIFRDYHAMAPRPNEQREPQVAFALTSPGTASDTTIQATEGDDADIIISPTTGILLTTSQETTQLHLPGHSRPRCQLGDKLKSPLWERIYRVCSRYEQLYVLVTHPFHVNRRLQSSFNGNMLSSFRELVSFCSSFAQSCNVVPLVISLNRLTPWIVNLAKKHAILTPWSEKRLNPDGTINVASPTTPCEDPDVWEHFLYQAGLNCFAAQMVLYSPALPHSISSEEKYKMSPPPCVALSRFISLDPRDRMRIYGPVIGEKGVFKVGNQLETEW